MWRNPLKASMKGIVHVLVGGSLAGPLVRYALESLDTDWTKLGDQLGDLSDLSSLHSWLISTSFLAAFQQHKQMLFFSL